MFTAATHLESAHADLQTVRMESQALRKAPRTDEYFYSRELQMFQLDYVILFNTVEQWKGSEPEWSNQKLNVGNCLKSSKMD